MRTATVLDGDGPSDLTLERSGALLLANAFNSGDSGRLCVSSHDLASITNTDRINIVRHQPAAGAGVVEIDESNGEFAPGATPETDGHPEIEITVLDDPGFSSELHVFGTRGGNDLRAGGHGRIDVGGDDDADITDISARRLLLAGGEGPDFLAARGFGGLVGSAVPVDESGGPGPDTIVGSTVGNDRLDGNSGNDTLFWFNQRGDAVNGQTGFDTATTDPFDLVQFNDIESRNSVSVGRARLARHRVRARVGRPTRLGVTWTHPKSWRALKMVNLQAFDGAVPIGNVYVRMHDGRITAHGALQLTSARLVRHGKTAGARLSVRLSRTLAGKTLRLAVQAADRHGHLQEVPEAGELRVTR